jgi:predicted Zn-dependent peptidase
MLEDFVKNPIFPEDKLKILVQNEMQQFVMNREKTDVLAADEFIPRIFGDGHPYGKVRKLDDYENINLEQLKMFHNRYYNASNCKIIVSGKLNTDVKNILENYLGNNDWISEKADSGNVELKELSTGRFVVKKPNAVQSSIMIGKRTITRKHADYFGLSILNTILGGYFGSRLMANLREKNALTYGVYSGLSSLIHAGSLSISANVNSEHVEKAIEQIYREIRILQQELVPDEELQMVKSYIAGEMLRAFDGPLAVSEIFMDLLPYGLDLNYYQNYFDTLKTIKSKTLRELANEYLERQSFVEVVAGNI